MKIRIWGARGSIPSPIKPDAIEEKIVNAILQMPPIDTTDESAVRAYVQSLPPLVRGTAGGNTACVEIQAGRDIFIMDAGSGIRELGLELMKGACGRGEGVIHIFFSHPHWDHIQGFPFFAPAFIPGNRLYFYSIHPVKTALENQQHPLTFPVSLDYMRAERKFITVEVGQPFTVGHLTVNTIPNAHPGVAYSYRFEDKNSVFVFASDAEYKNLDEQSIRPYINFFRNADLLLFDAQYTLKEAWQKVDWGHSSAMIGVDLARAAGAKRLLLFHHDPTNSDAELLQVQQTAEAYRAQDTSLPQCEIIVAYEGLTIDLSPPGEIDVQLTAERNAAVLTPSSAFTHHSIGQLETQLVQLMAQETHSTPILDLSQIETLSVAGLKALLALHRKKGGSQVVLANPSPGIIETIKLSGYENIFAIYPSVEAALTAVKTRETLNLPGQLVGDRYRIEQKLGESPLGIALKATDTRTGHPVAVKILSPFFGAETTAKFLQFAPDVRQLNHPAITRLLDYAQTENYTFLVEAFIAGEPLQSRLDNLSPAERVAVVRHITDALAYAHSFGVVHGDLKPQNIFLLPDGVNINGFGLGHLDEGHNLLEAPLLLLNTPYLAPEQIRGEPIDARTDLYAFGVLLYRLFTGRLPFSGDEQQILQAHLLEMPPPPRQFNPEISPLLEHIILRLLAKNPDDRYPAVTAVKNALHRMLGGDRPPLVRRTAQKRLAALWEKTVAGQGQIIAITGEAGAGKSTFAREFCAARSDAVVGIGETFAAEISLPYAPFAEILCAYLKENPRLPENPQMRGILATIAPILRPCAADFRFDPAPVQPSVAAMRQFLRDIHQFLAQESQRQPWLILLEDIHRADRATLDLLYYLLRRLSTMRVMVLVTYRPSALDETHPLTRMLQKLADAGIHPETIVMHGFRDAGVRKLLTRIFGGDVPSALVQKIRQHTGGNPLYVEEIAYGLLDDGRAVHQNGAWHFAAPESIRFPGALREAIWRRLHHLDPDTQTLLRQSAVWGETFNLKNLNTVSGLSDSETLNQLDDALARLLIVEMPAPGEFAPRHSEIQRVLYADIGVSRRLLLHRQIAAALEREPVTPRRAVWLAHHYEQADMPEKALPYCVQAAEQAMAMYAPKVAMQWYNRAQTMLNQLSPQTLENYHTLRNTVHHMLGQAYTEFKEVDELLDGAVADGGE